jgi:hypothetical protein
MVAGNQILRAGCWSHVRRKIIEAEKAALYAVEKQASDLSIAERLDLHRTVLAELRDKFLAWRSSPSIPWPSR